MRRRHLALIGIAVAVGVGALPIAQEVRKWRGCNALRDNAAAAARTIPGSGKHVYVLGDSWTSHWGLTDAAESYPSVLARVTGWEVTVDGFPGSGFTDGSACGGEAFAERAQQLPGSTDLVLLVGGLNDTDTPSEVAEDAEAALRAARAAAPQAEVVIVGPADVTVRDSASVDTALAVAARDQDASYVSTRGWPIDLTADGLHPTSSGHRAFGERLAVTLLG